MTSPPAFLVGTRGSALALAQAGQVLERMRPLFPGTELRLEVIKTSGDRLSAALDEGPLTATVQGLFTKELDEALLAGRIGAAIHSLKDVPTLLSPGLSYGAFLERGDCRDVLISRDGRTFAELPAGSRIGTSSPRREALVKAARPDLSVVPLRGNLDTRLRKLDEGGYEALLVAGAGVARLGREAEITERLDPRLFLPAPAQGVLCLVARAQDEGLLWTLASLDHGPSRLCAGAERSFLRALQGGCRVPVGALAELRGDALQLSGVIADPFSGKVLRAEATGPAADPTGLGERLADILLSRGAGEILRKYGR